MCVWQSPEESVRVPEAAATGSWEPADMGAGWWNSGLLEEQHVLFPLSYLSTQPPDLDMFVSIARH